MRKYLIAIALFVSATAFGQSLTTKYAARLTDPRTYSAYRVRTRIKVDGKLKESDWKKAASTDLFMDIRGADYPAPKYDTRVKMLWDDDYLYIGATLDEPNLVGNLRQRDTIVWKQNDFEVFLDPDGDGTGYFEIETSVRGTLLDLIMDKPYRSGGNFYSGWDCPGLKVGIYCKGTIGKASDTDQYWTVEMAIPRKALMWGFTEPDSLPYWRINFSRVEWLNKEAEENWVWSPTGEVNMHMPERWGYLFFVDASAGSRKAAPALDLDVEAYRLLWAMFYAQQDAKSRTGKYLSLVSEFGMSAAEQEKALSIDVESTSESFAIRLIPRNTRLQYCIDQDGRFAIRNAPAVRMR